MANPEAFTVDEVNALSAVGARAWHESAVRVAARAYESAHGNAIADRRQGLRWRARPRLVVSVTVALASLSAALWWWGASPQAVEISAPAVVESSVPVASLPSPAALAGIVTTPPTTVVAHVAGAVVKPGLVELEAGSRIADAIELAGGPTEEAELDAVNLARLVVDGEQILVPEQGSALADAGADAAAGAVAPVSLSTGTASQLESLPGIGPVIAARIVDDREANGPYSSLGDLTRVSGVGDVLVASLDGLAVP